ncbi:hypothetical protein GCM10011317_20700 [Niveispirillum cyanobacteriorum]|nr:hypothetical protein GCM10011317_20700 [Niveispirillum cyanobacteriorum]
MRRAALSDRVIALVPGGGVPVSPVLADVMVIEWFLSANDWTNAYTLCKRRMRVRQRWAWHALEIA